MRTRPSRSRRRGLLPVLVALALTAGATAAAGLQPSSQRSIPDSAFVPVTIDTPDSMAPGLAAAGDPARSRPVGPIADPWLLATQPPGRARPALPATKPIVVARPTRTASPRQAGSSSASSSGAAPATHAISGRASWYCDAGVSPCTVHHPDTSGFDAYAAAGPRLRAAIGSGWRGTVVTVDGIRVKLIDWCQCYKGEPNEKLLDLYRDVFLRTGSPVTVRW